MALEICFQVSTVPSTARATASLHTQQTFPFKEKLNLPSNNNGRPKRVSSFLISSLSSTSLPSIIGSHNRRTRGLVCAAKNAVDEVLEATDVSWSELVVESKKPVMVEFWAPWCGPCRMIAPVIEELAKDYAGKMVFLKVNTDDCPSIATKYGIRSIPTVLLFKEGDKKESIIGAVPKSTLCTTIEKYLEV